MFFFCSVLKCLRLILGFYIPIICFMAQGVILCKLIGCVLSLYIDRMGLENCSDASSTVGFGLLEI